MEGDSDDCGENPGGDPKSHLIKDYSARVYKYIA